jgi:hypothetical protein
MYPALESLPNDIVNHFVSLNEDQGGKLSFSSIYRSHNNLDAAIAVQLIKKHFADERRPIAPSCQKWDAAAAKESEARIDLSLVDQLDTFKARQQDISRSPIKLTAWVAKCGFADRIRILD